MVDFFTVESDEREIQSYTYLNGLPKLPRYLQSNLITRIGREKIHFQAIQ